MGQEELREMAENFLTECEKAKLNCRELNEIIRYMKLRCKQVKSTYEAEAVRQPISLSFYRDTPNWQSQWGHKGDQALNENES